MKLGSFFAFVKQMSCTGPTTKNVLLNQVLQVVFQLRHTPFPGASVEQVWALYQTLYPDSTYTQAQVEQALRRGAQRGMFTRCMYPSYSNVFYYGFNGAMIYSNVKNREFGIPAIMDTNLSGSGYMCGSRNLPLAAQLMTHGTQGGNHEACCPPPSSPVQQPSLSSRIRAAEVRARLTCSCPE